VKVSVAVSSHASDAVNASIAGQLLAAIDGCVDALDKPPMPEATAALREHGFGEAECANLIAEVGSRPDAARQVAQLRDRIGPGDVPSTSIERCLLLHTVARRRGKILRLEMGDGVLRCLCDELRFLAAPPNQDALQLRAPSDNFVSMAKIVTMRRFPAGQLQIERSGIPLSWLARVGARGLTILLPFLARRTRGRRPFFFHHIAWRRKNRLFLLEIEQNRSYYRIAQALESHPEVRGLLTESWLHSPDTFGVSPHLAWLNKPFLENGGLILSLGAASESSGVFAGGGERRRLFEQGMFRPTTAMAIWPRAAMLEWARSHPELAD
jgi:hypothetical protein